MKRRGNEAARQRGKKAARQEGEKATRQKVMRGCNAGVPAFRMPDIGMGTSPGANSERGMAGYMIDRKRKP